MVHPNKSLGGALSTTFPKKIGKRRKDTVDIIMLGGTILSFDLLSYSQIII